MDWLIALGSLALGALLAWLFLRAREMALRAQLAALTPQLVDARAQFDAARAALDAARSAVAERDTRLAQLGATLEAERASATEKLVTLQDAQSRLKDAFKALSSEALNSNNDAFLKLAQTALAQFQEGARGDLEKRQQAIDSLVKPLRESLEKVDTHIGEIEKARGSAYSALNPDFAQRLQP